MPLGTQRLRAQRVEIMPFPVHLGLTSLYIFAKVSPLL